MWVSHEMPSSSYCVMSYFWWGCRRNLKLITLGSERVKLCSLSEPQSELYKSTQHWIGKGGEGLRKHPNNFGQDCCGRERILNQSPRFLMCQACSTDGVGRYQIRQNCENLTTLQAAPFTPLLTLSGGTQGWYFVHHRYKRQSRRGRQVGHDSPGCQARRQANACRRFARTEELPRRTDTAVSQPGLLQ